MDRLTYSVIKVTDTEGNVWLSVVADMSDTVQVYGLIESFESEAYHLSAWCEELAYDYATRTEMVTVDDFA